MTSLYKIPFILTVAWFYDRSFIPPTLPATLQEQKQTHMNERRNIGWYEKIAVPILPPWTRIIYWLFSVIEIAVILAHHLPAHPISTHILSFLHISPTSTSPIRITPTFILGGILIISGALIRFRCFREMGRQFTFALSLKSDHRLITTGPYSIVRHPAYTGGNMTVMGAVCTLMGTGSWWLNGGGYRTMIGKLLAGNFAISGGLIVWAFLRGKKEDTYLREVFGERWSGWVKNVPYRYIPGVY